MRCITLVGLLASAAFATTTTKHKAPPKALDPTDAADESHHSVGPKPVVLVGDGRSGATITMVTLATLTESCPAPGMQGFTRAHDKDEDKSQPLVSCPNCWHNKLDSCWLQIFGENVDQAMEVTHPAVRMMNYFDRMKEKFPESPLVGFQFKTFGGRGYLQLQEKAKEAGDENRYKAVWSWMK